MNLIYNKKGNLLLLGVVVVAIILGSIIFLSSFIISSLKQGSLSNDALQSWHLADSGSEYLLYKFRKLKDFNIPGSDIDLEGGRVKFIEETEDSINVNIPKNDFYQVDIYQPGGGQQIDSLSLNGETDNGWLEVQIASWQTTTGQDSQMPVIQSIHGPSEISSSFSEPIPSSGYYHRVKLKALYDDINNLEIQAFDGGNSVAIPSYLAVRVRGLSEKAIQEISFTMPKKNPSYGLFDYVIFSEQQIQK